MSCKRLYPSEESFGFLFRFYFDFVATTEMKCGLKKKEELMTENNKMKQLMLYPCG